MSSLQLLINGFGGALTPENLLSAVIGCFLGTVIGVLPGIGSATTVALMIPIAFTLRPETALIMMTAVYLGSMYGGSLTSILLHVPGESSSIMTMLDGFEMAKQGRGGPALAIAAIGSFLGGTFSVMALTAVALPVASMALAVGPADYTSLMICALLLAAVLMGKDLIKGLAAMLLGLLIATIGIDWQTGTERLTFGTQFLMNGIDPVLVLIGTLGIGEVVWFLTHRHGEQGGERLALRGRLWLDKKDWKQALPAVARGSVIGFIAGVLPGSGSTLGSMMAYTFEQRVSRHPERFGKGAIEGVASPETANNAATGGALIPMLTLGIPGSSTTAVLLLALTMYGVQPGPLLMAKNPQIVWAVIASLYTSNIILLIMNLPLIPLFVRIIDVPVRFLMPLIIAIAAVGVYASGESFEAVVLAFGFGGLGYLLRLYDVPQVALVLGVVLGPRIENYLRQAILISKGDWLVFFTRPISAAFLIFTLAFLAWDTWSKRQRRRKGAHAPELEG